ncbi:hypothetical protein DKX38_024896 [Salix brachista]|nr:hypothetical protein DKX38_024896 [Salix brachista]
MDWVLETSLTLFSYKPVRLFNIFYIYMCNPFLFLVPSYLPNPSLRFHSTAKVRCGGNQGFAESNMAKHHPDLIMCRKQPGIAIGRLCEKDDGKCVICDSYVRPCTLVRVCDECNYGSFQGRCVICGGVGISDAYYCKECTQMEKDRDGCPKIVNLGSAKTDLFYERKKYGFKKR